MLRLTALMRLPRFGSTGAGCDGLCARVRGERRRRSDAAMTEGERERLDSKEASRRHQTDPKAAETCLMEMLHMHSDGNPKEK